MTMSPYHRLLGRDLLLRFFDAAWSRRTVPRRNPLTGTKLSLDRKQLNSRFFTECYLGPAAFVPWDGRTRARGNLTGPTMEPLWHDQSPNGAPGTGTCRQIKPLMTPSAAQA